MNNFLKFIYNKMMKKLMSQKYNKMILFKKIIFNRQIPLNPIQNNKIMNKDIAIK